MRVGRTEQRISHFLARSLVLLLEKVAEEQLGRHVPLFGCISEGGNWQPNHNLVPNASVSCMALSIVAESDATSSVW